jgi:hypothetical protein
MSSIENEYHFLLVCPFYREIRNACLPKYYCHWPNSNKFKTLLSSTQNSILNKTSRFIYLANVKKNR